MVVRINNGVFVHKFLCKILKILKPRKFKIPDFAQVLGFSFPLFPNWVQINF